MRAATRNARLGACAQAIEPKVNIPMAARNTVREPNRSARRPLAGMNMASVSKYDVNATFICSGSALKLLAMVGRAVAKTVPSNCSMNIALATMSDTARGLAPRFGGTVTTGSGIAAGNNMALVPEQRRG